MVRETTRQSPHIATKNLQNTKYAQKDVDTTTFAHKTNVQKTNVDTIKFAHKINVDTTKFAHKTNVHTIKFANNVWAQTNYTHKILTQKLQCKETGLVTPCYCFQPKLGCNTVLVLQPTVQVQTGRKRPKVIASNHRFPKSDAHALK